MIAGAAVDWGEKDVYVHANRKAPRCLPCDYRDPLENTTDIWGWNAIPVRVHPSCPNAQLLHWFGASSGPSGDLHTNVDDPSCEHMQLSLQIQVSCMMLQQQT